MRSRPRDGNPATVLPAPEAALAAELASLAGGAARLAERAAQAAPEDRCVHEVRARVYQSRPNASLSLMAKGIFADAARRSRAVVEAADAPDGTLREP